MSEFKKQSGVRQEDIWWIDQDVDKYLHGYEIGSDEAWNAANRELGFPETEGKKILSGTWSLPYSENKAESLKEIIGKLKAGNMTVINAMDKLYSVYGDDQLFDDLERVKDDPKKASEVIKNSVNDLVLAYKSDPGTFKEKFDLKSLDILKSL